MHAWLLLLMSTNLYKHILQFHYECVDHEPAEISIERHWLG